jgi:hypothetical protein
MKQSMYIYQIFTLEFVNVFKFLFHKFLQISQLIYKHVHH